MKAKIYPSICHGEVVLPPSKSMAHRAIICASLANGRSVIKNIAYSQDIVATIEGMRKLGAIIEEKGDTLYITGVKSVKNIEERVIDCNESGSTLRFFIPIFSLTGDRVKFVGRNRLMQRPQKVFEKIFLEQGLHYYHDESSIEIEGSLKSGEYVVEGNISSQFISGLLFSLPLLQGDSIIKIVPPFESKSYIDLTLDMLERFGVRAEFVDELTIKIYGGQNYLPQEYSVEGDFSQLGFFAVLGALNNSLICKGLNTKSKQGDKEIIEILKRCGIEIEEIEDGYVIHRGVPTGIDINLENCPDLGPILTVLSAFGRGDFKIYNAQRLRYKESDRILAMEEELRKLGVNISSDESNIYISGRDERCEYQQIYGHKDHRIVMSMAIAGTLLNSEITIEGAEAISKSYPDFFEVLKKIGVKVELILV